MVFGSIIVLTVCALSATEIPVLVPCLASTDTVKAVVNLEVLSLTIIGIFSSSSRSPITGMQIKPLPFTAIKFIASGVTFSAAMARSPSFSLSSSSTIMTNLPAFISLIASSMLANPIITPLNLAQINSPRSHAPVRTQRLYPHGEPDQAAPHIWQ